MIINSCSRDTLGECMRADALAGVSQAKAHTMQDRVSKFKEANKKRPGFGASSARLAFFEYM